MDGKRVNTFLTGVVTIVILIWISGALLVAFNTEFQKKAECINNEGLIKGWLWCETDDTGRFFGVQFTVDVISGLRWPLGYSANKKFTENTSLKTGHSQLVL